MYHPWTHVVELIHLAIKRVVKGYCRTDLQHRGDLVVKLPEGKDMGGWAVLSPSPPSVKPADLELSE